ncbi:MAG: glycosyltransferase [Methanobacterium sp.]|jgi:succinoglycan biosynthesis protein ExoA
MATIDIIVGVKNEEEYIGRCLKSLEKQTIKDINILVIDGLSDDRTRDIVCNLMDKDPRIKLLINKKEKISPARNLGFNASKADFVAYLDGHAIVADDWLETLYHTFITYEKKCKIAGVGSAITSPPDDSSFGKTIAYCLKTFFGGFGTQYSEEKNIHPVKTVPFVLYRRSLLVKEGIIYNENMTQCEDTDFNHQIIKKGYVLLKHPKAVVYMYRRKNLREFFRQMIKYGEGRSKLSIKYNETLNLQHLIPVLIVFYLLFIIFSLIISTLNLINIYTLTLILIPIIIYILTDLSYTIIIMMKYQSLKHIYAFLIFPAEHLGYGIGFLKGLIDEIK